MSQDSTVDGQGSEGGAKIGEAIVRLVEEAKACWERLAWKESERPLAEALELAGSEAGLDSPAVAWVLRHTAWLAMRMERYADAVAEYRRALAIHEAAAGPDHPDAVSVRTELAGALFALGGAGEDEESSYRESDEQALRAIAAMEAAGREDLELAECLAAAGWRRYWIGRYEGAEPLQARALRLFERLAGPADPRTARAACQLGLTYDHGRVEGDAAPFYARALAGYEERLHDAHPDVLDARARLATYLSNTGREYEAAPHFDGLVAALLDEAAEVDWDDRRWYVDGCADYLRAAGRHDELEHLERLAARYNVMVASGRERLAQVEGLHGPASVECADALGVLAHSLAHAGRPEEAVEAADRALKILRARLAPDDPAIAEAEEQVDVVRAAAEFHAARPPRRKRLGRDEPTTFGDLFSTPWADERRGDLIRSYLDALASEGDDEADPSGALMAVTSISFMADADDQWPFILELIAAAPDDPDVLQHIAAGPLEGFLGRFDGEAIDRVEPEAARDPKFRRVLSGVWKHGMSDPVWARVRAIQKTVPDPLPEMRPFDDEAG